MKARIEKMMGGRANAGMTMLEIVAVLVIVAIVAGGVAVMFFTTSSSARENNAQSAALSVNTAVQSYYGAYGKLPEDANDIEAYIERSGDTAPGDLLRDTVRLTVYEDPSAPAPNAVVVVAEDYQEFSNVIVVDRNGRAEKVAPESYTAPTTDVIAQWVSDEFEAPEPETP